MPDSDRWGEAGSPRAGGETGSSGTAARPQNLGTGPCLDTGPLQTRSVNGLRRGHGSRWLSLEETHRHRGEAAWRRRRTWEGRGPQPRPVREARSPGKLQTPAEIRSSMGLQGTRPTAARSADSCAVRPVCGPRDAEGAGAAGEEGPAKTRPAGRGVRKAEGRCGRDGARGAAAGTATAGGRRQHRGPGQRWSASPGAGARRSPLPAERARPCGREHAEALVGRDAGGRGSLSTLPSCPRSSELHGPGRRQLQGPLPGNPHPGSTHRLADPGWALCLEVPVEPQTPSCPSQGSEPSHRSSHSASASAPGQSFFPGRISSPPERPPPLQAPDCAVWDGVCGHSRHCVPGRAGARSHRLSQ